MLPTVRIASDEVESGFIIINESDFDPKAHTLWSGHVPEPKREPSAYEKAESLSAAQIKDELSKRGIGYKANTSKADLLALLFPSSKGV